MLQTVYNKRVYVKIWQTKLMAKQCFWTALSNVVPTFVFYVSVVASVVVKKRPKSVWTLPWGKRPNPTTLVENSCTAVCTIIAYSGTFFGATIIICPYRGQVQIDVGSPSEAGDQLSCSLILRRLVLNRVWVWIDTLCLRIFDTKGTREGMV